MWFMTPVSFKVYFTLHLRKQTSEKHMIVSKYNQEPCPQILSTSNICGKYINGKYKYSKWDFFP